MVPRSVIYGSSGAARLPSSEVKIDGKDHPMDVLIQTFSALEKRRSGSSVTLCLSTFPTE
jgi:hypothetical protein